MYHDFSTNGLLNPNRQEQFNNLQNLSGTKNINKIKKKYKKRAEREREREREEGIERKREGERLERKLVQASCCLRMFLSHVQKLRET